jgi:hypothetical protein
MFGFLVHIWLQVSRITMQGEAGAGEESRVADGASGAGKRFCPWGVFPPTSALITNFPALPCGPG